MRRRTLLMTALIALFGMVFALPAAAQEICDIDPETGECVGQDNGDGGGEADLPRGVRDHALPNLEKVAERLPFAVTCPENGAFIPGFGSFARAAFAGGGKAGGSPSGDFITNPDRMAAGHGGLFAAKDLHFGCG